MYSLVEASCPLCSEFNADIEFSFPKHKLNVVKCKSCQMVWTTPRARKQDLDSLYEPNYYDSFVSKLEKSSPSTFGRLIDRKKRQQLLHSFARRLDILTKAVPTPDAKLLEIGCENGDFLLYLRDHGWQATGIDISRHAVTLATKQGLQVFQGELNELHLESNEFDAIIMYHVLEHVYSPRTFLREIHRILKPKGILIIEVPNIDSHSAKFFGPRWMPLSLPLHVSHFSPRTLTSMLTQHHFAVKTMIHSSPDASNIWKLGFKAIIRMLLRRELEPSVFRGYADDTQRSRESSGLPLRTEIIDFFLDPFFLLTPLLERLVSSGSNFTTIASLPDLGPQSNPVSRQLLKSQAAKK